MSMVGAIGGGALLMAGFVPATVGTIATEGAGGAVADADAGTGATTGTSAATTRTAWVEGPCTSEYG